jgi:hypothetical protein
MNIILFFCREGILPGIPPFFLPFRFSTSPYRTNIVIPNQKEMPNPVNLSSTPSKFLYHFLVKIISLSAAVQQQSYGSNFPLELFEFLKGVLVVTFEDLFHFFSGFSYSSPLIPNTIIIYNFQHKQSNI